VLAEKMSYLALVDPPSDTPEAREAAATHADRALTFAGQKANAVFNIARQRIHAGRVEDGGRGLRRAARLDPGSAVAVFLSEHWRHQCTATPPVEIRQAIAFHSGLNAHHPARWVSAAAIAEMHLNNGDFTRAEHWARDARERSQALTVTYTLAAALAQQGKDMEARKIIEQQRSRWPNLDLHHYADAAIPRLCAGAEKQDFLQGIYRDLADDLSAAQENRDKLPK
jgi:tetratricopeptide (TPR) repeat protein